MNDRFKEVLADLPKYEDIVSWTNLLQCVQEFQFVNIFMYLVESKDKTFDHSSMRAIFR